jgi:hypothetical protein
MTMPLWRELAVTSSFRRGSAMLNVIKEALSLAFAVMEKELLELSELNPNCETGCR